MEGPNYFRAAVEFFKRKGKIPGSLRLADAIQSAMTAHKYALPKGGKVLDNDLRALPDVIRLPYPTVVIEYYQEEDPIKPIAEAALEKGRDDSEIRFMVNGGFQRDKLIVIAQQEGEDNIHLQLIYHSPKISTWTTAPFECVLPATKEGLVALLEEGRLSVRVDREIDIDQEWFERIIWQTMIGPVKAVYELVEALSFSNISEMDIPAKKMTFTETRKKALPYDSYKVLVVDKSKQIVGAGRSEPREPVEPGERRQVREHTRSGHDRTYKRSGKKIWINPMVINAGVGGKIIKDYELK